jgi:hypothetical protein
MPICIGEHRHQECAFCVFCVAFLSSLKVNLFVDRATATIINNFYRPRQYSHKISSIFYAISSILLDLHILILSASALRFFRSTRCHF